MNRFGRILVALVFVVSFSPEGLAATFIVNSTTDATDANPGDGICSTAAAACTLRAAIQEANALAGADIITVPAGTYTLSLAGVSEDAAATGDLDITEDLTINGAGAATTIIDGGALDRLFDVRQAVNTASLSGLTIRNGSTTALGAGFGAGLRTLSAGIVTVTASTFSNNVSGGFGGAISNDDVGTLTIAGGTLDANAANGFGGAVNNNDSGTINLTNNVITANNATNFAGGVNNNSDGTINIAGGTITGNTAGGYGGGVNNNSSGGTINISNSVINSNTAGGFGGGGVNNNSGGTVTIATSDINNNTADNGGGINNNSIGTLQLTDSNVVGNTMSGGFIGGGGILNNSIGPMTIIRSTISGNAGAGFGGGGIANNSAGALTISNSTISGNTHPVRGGGIYNNSVGSVTLTHVTVADNSAPGGANLDRASGTVNLQNSIIADPTGSANCAGTITSAGDNIATDASCGLTASGDLPSTDPLLGPLQNNGGRTSTHALMTGSPAIDTANAAACLATDQRGVARPQGAGCDMGAYEAQLAAQADLSLTKADSPDPVAVGQNLTYTLIAGNAGPAAATGVTVVDTLPAGVTFISASSTVGTCIQAAGTVTCTIGALASGGTATVTITVSPTAPGVLTNSATISGAETDPSAANNTATTTTTAQPGASVPTLSGLMLLLLVGAIAVAGALLVGRF